MQVRTSPLYFASRSRILTQGQFEDSGQIPHYDFENFQLRPRAMLLTASSGVQLYGGRAGSGMHRKAITVPSMSSLPVVLFIFRSEAPFVVKEEGA